MKKTTIKTPTIIPNYVLAPPEGGTNVPIPPKPPKPPMPPKPPVRG